MNTRGAVKKIWKEVKRRRWVVKKKLGWPIWSISDLPVPDPAHFDSMGGPKRRCLQFWSFYYSKWVHSGFFTGENGQIQFCYNRHPPLTRNHTFAKCYSTSLRDHLKKNARWTHLIHTKGKSFLVLLDLLNISRGGLVVLCFPPPPHSTTGNSF